MIAFAACVADPEKFRTIAAPGLRTATEPDSPVIEAETTTSIFEAYNEILDAVRPLDDLEALVLLHEDTEILDPGFCTKVREVLADGTVGVIGVVGGRGGDGLAWWTAPAKAGKVTETRGVIDFGTRGTVDVDAVDGLLLVLSPWAVRELRFDTETFTGFDAYDADICAQARAAGKRVVVAELEVAHRHNRTGTSRTDAEGAADSADDSSYARADEQFRAKWAAGSRVQLKAAPATTDDGSPTGAGVRDGHDSGDDDYFEWTRPEIRVLVPPTARRVLDVGCGAGGLGAALKAEGRPGLQVFGLEGFPEAADRARERLDGVFCLDLDGLEELPEDLGTFDTIIFGDVLEHLRDPARLLRTLRDALTEDGVIICSIPNVKHWSVIMPLLVHDRWEYQDAGLLDRTHVHFFTLEEISLMLDECGYTAQHVGVNDLAPLPAELHALVEVAVAFGADREETAARLGAYQYMIVAGRA
ncbi:MAG: methyltransferase domain-containing protein [Solirubrobacteraceae bacterium]|nr:methyltransferase domain-containing protein [Solirubrobacteraceae bacterium]